MIIVKKESPASIKGPDNWFTGTAWIEFIKAEPETPSQVTAARVTFEPGARSNWHKHPLGQLLIVTDGVGWTQVEGEPKVEFKAGDVMACPKDKKHWHGATQHSSMTHIAVQEALDGKNVEWYEPVSDADYLAPIKSD
ncbi:cupin [Oleiphilus messinensis]|uniref:Cupin n=2 Tax=Oleiphilus messinensis TaxID=141451 RepID=A0A1Y0IAB3_9GAMM|nr:cupin [Oleiphilus messinensis]